MEQIFHLPQLSTEPEEPKEPSLPKNCYFNDGKTKVDYVIVYPKLGEQVRGDQVQQQINQFMNTMKEKGLLIENEAGKFYKELMFMKMHAPHKVLVRFAKIFNIELSCNNPYYKYRETVFSSCLHSLVTRPDRNSEIYRRASKTLSGERPLEITTAERSLIVHRILQSIKLTVGGEDVNLRMLLDRDIFIYVYPIHDGDHDWTESGPLTDRQILFRYWASFRSVFKLQPIHLVEKYYGPRVAFYFAFQSLYTKMLLIPTIIGVITTIAGIVYLLIAAEHIDEEVCKSKIILCSDQYLKTACGMMKLAYIIDNPLTIVYVIVCSCWGAALWNIWQRRQAILRIRWNLTAVKADRTMRQEFKENARTRRSSITGETEYYVPAFKKVIYFAFTNTVVLIMVIIFVLILFTIVHYRFWLRKKLNYDETSYANEIELFSSTAITTLIIFLLNSCSPLLLKFYSKIMHFLTAIRLPRTQSQYNRMYLHKMFIIQFANFFMPLFYLAFIKGFFFTYPGNVSSWFMIKNVQLDRCNPSGCLVDLGTQLVTLIIVNTLRRYFIGFIKYLKLFLIYITYPIHRIKVPLGPENQDLGQWEKDFPLETLNHSNINALYAELVMQYSFITFFNASLPIIGLLALFHNVLKLHYDAFRFLKHHRRPVAEKVPDIEGWNQILRVVTIFGTISNAFVVAFRTDFVLRILYRIHHNNSFSGFVNSTLSEFSLDDYEGDIIDHAKNTTSCFYRGFRYPPSHPKKYNPTKEFWHQIAIRAVYFIVLENFTLLLSLFFSFVIPQIPRKVKVKLEHDTKLLREAQEARMEEQSKSPR